METKKRTTRKLDLLTAVEKVVELSIGSHLDAEFFKKAAKPLKFISEKMELINQYMLQRQEELLPDIIAFNDALREALHKMFDKAHAVYEANKDFGEDVTVEACCFLGNNYPALHPLQGENRQDL